MIIIYGRRMYGRVNVSGPTSVLTEFAHIYYLPIAPIRSHLILSSDAGGLRGVAIPLHGLSVLAAYLRAWGIVGTIACLLGLLGAIGSEDDFVELLPWV